MAGAKCPCQFLSRRVQHIFDEDAIARRGVVHQHMGHGADDLSILKDGAAAHSLDKPK